MNAITSQFTFGDSTEQFREYITLLFHLAKMGGNDSTTIDERMHKAQTITDAYVEFRGEKPDSTQLSRLASLIMLDKLTDRHPDKGTREEYPIMSGWQTMKHEEKYRLVSEIAFNDRSHNGRRKSFYTDADEGNWVTNGRIPNEVPDEIIDADRRALIDRLIECAKLTEKQREAMRLVFEDDLTHAEAGRRMGIRQQVLSRYIDASITKIKRNMVEITP